MYCAFEEEIIFKESITVEPLRKVSEEKGLPLTLSVMAVFIYIIPLEGGLCGEGSGVSLKNTLRYYPRLQLYTIFCKDRYVHFITVLYM